MASNIKFECPACAARIVCRPAVKKTQLQMNDAETLPTRKGAKHTVLMTPDVSMHENVDAPAVTNFFFAETCRPAPAPASSKKMPTGIGERLAWMSVIGLMLMAIVGGVLALS